MHVVVLPLSDAGRGSHILMHGNMRYGFGWRLVPLALFGSVSKILERRAFPLSS